MSILEQENSKELKVSRLLKEMELMSHKHVQELTDLHNFYEIEMINYKLLQEKL